MRLIFAVVIFAAGWLIPAHSENIEGDKWIEQLGKASTACLAQFRRKFGDVKGHDFADCLTDQSSKATKGCIGQSRSEFPNCFRERSLRVMETCDLTQC
jgi:hypothetical protein